MHASSCLQSVHCLPPSNHCICGRIPKKGIPSTNIETPENKITKHGREAIWVYVSLVSSSWVVSCIISTSSII
ncbi:unnamed protein product [Moneuplotes crassus]|uniref:Uncharacterized protein n=1 Tax=Euplotes crassus TaxID=5936 RepID=A0AAD1XY80_EUPCR|nr:unnamed protein product [Moneuplotes crassus]